MLYVSVASIYNEAAKGSQNKGKLVGLEGDIRLKVWIKFVPSATFGFTVFLVGSKASCRRDREARIPCDGSVQQRRVNRMYFDLTHHAF